MMDEGPIILECNYDDAYEHKHVLQYNRQKFDNDDIVMKTISNLRLKD